MDLRVRGLGVSRASVVLVSILSLNAAAPDDEVFPIDSRVAGREHSTAAPPNGRPMRFEDEARPLEERLHCHNTPVHDSFSL